MSYAITSTVNGSPLRATWDDTARRFVGDEWLQAMVVLRARRPLELTPTGPTLERPDPTLPGHALALAGAVMDIESVTGDVPAFPEGFGPDDFAVPEGAAA